MAGPVRPVRSVTAERWYGGDSKGSPAAVTAVTAGVAKGKGADTSRLPSPDAAVIHRGDWRDFMRGSVSLQPSLGDSSPQLQSQTLLRRGGR